jgi:hypothetical protein
MESNYNLKENIEKIIKNDPNFDKDDSIIEINNLIESRVLTIKKRRKEEKEKNEKELKKQKNKEFKDKWFQYVIKNLNEKVEFINNKFENEEDEKFNDKVKNLLYEYYKTFTFEQKLKKIDINNLDFGENVSCDNEDDCWYKGNLDRLGEIKCFYIIKYSSNNEMFCDSCYHNEIDNLFENYIQDSIFYQFTKYINYLNL